MNCPSCSNSLRIAKATYTSDVGSTDVYHEMKMVCANPECASYEPNMDEPMKFEMFRTKVN